MPEKVKIDIAWSAILKIGLAALIIYLVFVLKEVLILLFIVAILVAAFQPVVKKWSKKIGRGLAVLFLMLIFFTVIAGFAYLIVPPLVGQTGQLIDNIPGYINRIAILKLQFPALGRALSSLPQNWSAYTGSFINFTVGIFGGLASILTVLVLTVYLLLDQKIFTSLVKITVPKERHAAFIAVFSKITDKVGDWLRGQLILGLIMGLITFIGLSIIRVPYALTLGVIAGLLEFIPVIGPLISGTIASLIVLTVAPIKVIFVIILTILLNQAENNFIAPKILQKAVGLPPAIIIIAILIGSRLLGLVGAVLAVPISAILFVVFEEWETIKKIASK